MKEQKPVICIVGSISPRTGGMETYIAELLQSPLSKDFKLKLFNISKPNVRKKQSKKYTGYDAVLRRSIRLTFQSYALSLLFFTKFVFKLFTRRIDIVHIHSASYTSFWEKMFYIIIANKFGKSVVLHIHGALFDKFYQGRKPFFQKLIRNILNRCDRIMVLSEYWYNLFSQWIGPEKLSIVPNGIHVHSYMERYFDRSQSPSLLFLGELSTRKGIGDLIAVIPKLKVAIPDVQIYLAGPGDMQGLRNQASDLGIDGAIYFMGPVFDRDKLKLLQSSWVYVLPSYAEGQPMAIIEAMASGLLVVSTCVGGIPEMIGETEGNYIYEPGSLDDLVSGLISVLSDKDLCERAGKENQKAVLKYYNIEANMQRIADTYRQLL